ncbi:MAG TPA: YqgE/AlgH family protein [Spirochaetia bacterium]|nr:YqgE/AlgH family protein [Spirochaetia bacterium]
MEEQNEQDLPPNPEENPKNLGGHFLVSEIGLMDPNFVRSVILMITHDENGAFGLIVNRPFKLTLGELVEGLEESSASSIPVYVGGPVQQELLFILHTAFPGSDQDDRGERPVEGVIFEPATQSIVDYLKDEWSALPEQQRPAVRLYAGYSGWGPGQVEGELKAEAWVVVKANSDIIFHPNPAGAWADAFVKKGPLYQIILQTGFKPSMN